MTSPSLVWFGLVWPGLDIWFTLACFFFQSLLSKGFFFREHFIIPWERPPNAFYTLVTIPISILDWFN